MELGAASVFPELWIWTPGEPGPAALPRWPKNIEQKRTRLSHQEDTKPLITLDKQGREQEDWEWLYSTGLRQALGGPCCHPQPCTVAAWARSEHQRPQTRPLLPRVCIRTNQNRWRLPPSEKRVRPPGSWERKAGSGRRDRKPEVPYLAWASPNTSLGIMAQRRVPLTNLKCYSLQFPRPAEGSKAWCLLSWPIAQWSF